MYKNVEKLLKEKGMTAYELARKTGMSPSTLSDWKAGRYIPKFDKIKKIADFFGVTVDDLLRE